MACPPTSLLSFCVHGALWQVGYIIPVEGASPQLEGASAAAASPMDLGLSLWFVHADTPEQLCTATAKDDFRCHAHAMWPYD
jgi:hypothetical protein